MSDSLKFPTPAKWLLMDDLERLDFVNQRIATLGGQIVAEEFLTLLGHLPSGRHGYFSIVENLVKSLATPGLQCDFVHRAVLLEQGCYFGVVYAASLEHVRPGFARLMIPHLRSEWEQLHRAMCNSSCENCGGHPIIQELFFLSDVSSIIVNTEVTILTPRWADDPLLAAILMISIATAWTVRHSASRISGYSNIPPKNIQFLLEISNEAIRRLDETFESWHLVAHAGAIRRAMEETTETDGYLIDEEELLNYR